MKDPNAIASHKENEPTAEPQFGLHWNNTKIHKGTLSSFDDQIPVLNKVEENTIRTKSSDNNNILIEGDNYYALLALNYTHKEKIKLIYIDPPYNRGSEDNLNYCDNYRHGSWLSIMKERLILSHELLTEDGCIFISIDDNELFNLKLLCDEVFGESNFIANITWKSFHTVKNDAKNISKNTDFILVYQKNKAEYPKVLKNEYFDKSDKYNKDDKNGKGPYKLDPLTAKSGKESNRMPYEFNNGVTWQPPDGRYWGFSTKTLKKLEEDDEIIFNSQNNPSVKRYLVRVQEGKKSSTLWDGKDVGYNITADAEIKKLFGGKKAFKNPKPLKLIKKIISIASNDGDIILDYFAGSGTTGHAVLEINKECMGNRQFILCTNNERQICTNVTFPRIKKAIKGYQSIVPNKTCLYKREIRLGDFKLLKNKDANITTVVNDIDAVMKENKGVYKEIKKELSDNILEINGVSEKNSLVVGLGGNLHHFKVKLVKKVSNKDANRMILMKKCTGILCIKEGVYDKSSETNDFSIFQNTAKNGEKKYLCLYHSMSVGGVKKFIKKIEGMVGLKHVYFFSLGGKIDKSKFASVKNSIINTIPDEIIHSHKSAIRRTNQKGAV